jgi:hypothetical protein
VPQAWASCVLNSVLRNTHFFGQFSAPSYVEVLHKKEKEFAKLVSVTVTETNVVLVKMKEKNLLKIQPLPKVLRVQAILVRSKQLRR